MTYKNRTRSNKFTKAHLPCWSCIQKESGVVVASITGATPPIQSWTDSISDLVVDRSKPVNLSKKLHVKPCSQLKFKVETLSSQPDWYTKVNGRSRDELTTTGTLGVAAMQNVSSGHNRFFYETHSVGGKLPSISDIKQAYSSLDIGAFIGTDVLTDKNLLGFKYDLNILATIGELAEIRSLIDLMLPTRSVGSGVNRVLDPVTEKFLGYNFGLVPVYQDMLAIIERIQKLDDSISKWNQLAAKGVVLNEHANVPIPDVLKHHPYLVCGSDGKPVKSKRGIMFRIPREDKVQHTSNTFQPGRFIVARWRYSEFGTVYVKATASVYFKPIPLLTSAVSDLQYSLWGLNKPLSAIWELVPFSFVVDWFISIGDAIDRFETDQTLLQLQVIDACFSTRIRRESIFETYMDVQTTPTKVLNCGGQVVVATSYNRSVVAPKLVQHKPYFKLQYGLPNDSQSVLGSALLWQLLCAKKTKVSRVSAIFG